MNFLLPTKTTYSNFYEQSKFNLIWNFSIALSILLTIVSISNFANHSYNIWPNIVAVLIALIALLFLYKTKKYKIVAYFATSSMLILVSTTYFTLTNILHYTTPLWMILNVLLGFFILGRKWGVFLLISHFLILFIYIYTRMTDNIQNIPVYSKSDLWNFIIEISIVAFGIYYIIIQYLKTTKHALKHEKKINEELKRNNSIILKQNKEKELMLKEIHHRVKNNLQIITSILRLQSHQKSPNNFEEAILRIDSIALIHEAMYKQEFASNFDLETYFKNLSNNIISNYHFSKKIELDIRPNIHCTGCIEVVPLAILINELMTNSYKHAFDSIAKPSISISMQTNDNGTYSFDYSDNGNWKENTPPSFGSEMIETVVDQMEGEYILKKTSKGSKYSFIFKCLEV